ncbi:hypothetical protein E5225_00055 [Cellulomonas shaoxiangyii]|uniref:Transposase n=1 Tax=Cellulomonas shaoxiangyii TaxID=2566013 RepID=A0A4P7SHT4_9CELL|nr:hypothetical protein E5225_00055 [Cellulomonas shaoxiangyii]TGY86399.1 hypothetical protein E5226_02485 [Cellulomonas shaoxiangyii]
MSPISGGGSRHCVKVSASSRYRALPDEQWARVDPLLPSNEGRSGHPSGDNRRVVERILTGIGRGSRGETCRASSSARSRRPGRVIAMPRTGRGTGCWRGSSPRPTWSAKWTGPSRWTRRSLVDTSTRLIPVTRTRTQRAPSKHRNLPIAR